MCNFVAQIPLIHGTKIISINDKNKSFIDIFRYLFFMNDISRLYKIRKTLGMTQKQMAEILQIGQNTYSMIENGKIKLTDRNRITITEKLKINPIWIDTGIGDMMLEITSDSIKRLTTNDNRTKGVPYFAKPIAGLTILSASDIAHEEPEYAIDYQPFNDCTFYRPVYGESMAPKFNPGDTVACKRILNKDLILYGESYLCIVQQGTDFYETIKVIRRHKEDPQMLILKPMNPDYDESTLPADAITDLYIIKGKIERNL